MDQDEDQNQNSADGQYMSYIHAYQYPAGMRA